MRCSEALLSICLSASSITSLTTSDDRFSYSCPFSILEIESRFSTRSMSHSESS